MENLQENLQTHVSRFLEIMDCKDESLRKMRLEGLQNDMEAVYGIPQTGQLKIGAFRTSFPKVYRLYTKVKNARWS